MALIKCPECQREISDKSVACIHCGYPLDQYKSDQNEEKYYGVKQTKSMPFTWIAFTDIKQQLFDLSGLTYENTPYHTSDKVIVANVSKDKAELVLNLLRKANGDGEIFEDKSCTCENVKICDFFDKYFYHNTTPRCPKCRSTDIAVTTKGYSLLTGMVGANKPLNYCKNCGYKWDPSK